MDLVTLVIFRYVFFFAAGVTFLLSLWYWINAGFDRAVVAGLLAAVGFFVVAVVIGDSLDSKLSQLNTYACSNAACAYNIATEEELAFCPDCGDTLLAVNDIVNPGTCPDCEYDFPGEEPPAFCPKCGEAVPKYIEEGQ